MGKLFEIEALRDLSFKFEQHGCSANAWNVTAVHRRQTNPETVRQRRSRCLCPGVPMMKPAESRVGANVAAAIRFLLHQPSCPSPILCRLPYCPSPKVHLELRPTFPHR